MADSGTISPDAAPAGVLNDTLVMENFSFSDKWYTEASAEPETWKFG